MEAFTVTLEGRVRPCREEDLPALEWFGLFAGQRALVRRVFEQHRRGEALMLVAEVNGEPSGQLWVDLARAPAGELWAVRVLPCLQRRGIGARLAAQAEDWLRAQGFQRAQLTVELDNPLGRRFWERLGYRVAGQVAAADPPELGGSPPRLQWRLLKELCT